MAKNGGVLEVPTPQMLHITQHCFDKKTELDLSPTVHQWQKDHHLAWYRAGVDSLWAAHILAAASLKMPHMWRDLPRISKRLVGVPKDWCTLSHPGWGEDCCALTTTLAGPLGTLGLLEITLFVATMVKSRWPEPLLDDHLVKRNAQEWHWGYMHSRPFDQSACRELPCKARVWEVTKEFLDLVVQPCGEQIYCR